MNELVIVAIIGAVIVLAGLIVVIIAVITDPEGVDE